jgi:tight adherence protein B
VTPVLIAVLTLVVLVLAVTGVAVTADAAQRQRSIGEIASGERTGRVEQLRRAFNAQFRATSAGRRLEDKLAGASVSIAPLDFVVLVGSAAAAVLVLGRRPLGLLGALVFAAAVVYGASRWLERRRQKRVEAFVGQLPEVARVMSNATSAGLAMRRAVIMVADEVDEPAGREFGIVAEQIGLGVPLDQALEDLDRRLPSRELRVLVQTLIIQARAGGALVSALSNIAATLEQRKELRREVRTAISGALFSGYVVAGLGVGSVFVMNLITPGALDALAKTGLGRIVLIAAAALFAAGFLAIRRITRVEI